MAKAKQQVRRGFLSQEMERELTAQAAQEAPCTHLVELAGAMRRLQVEFWTKKSGAGELWATCQQCDRNVLVRKETVWTENSAGVAR